MYFDSEDPQKSKHYKIQRTIFFRNTRKLVKLSSLVDIIPNKFFICSLALKESIIMLIYILLCFGLVFYEMTDYRQLTWYVISCELSLINNVKPYFVS